MMVFSSGSNGSFIHSNFCSVMLASMPMSFSYSLLKKAISE